MRGAVRSAVEEGRLWLTNGPTSLWSEPVPEDVLTDAARLQARPERVPASALMDDALPGAWQEGATNGADLTRALSHARGEAMPWGLVRESIADGVDSRWLEIRDGDAEILHRAYREAGRPRAGASLAGARRRAGATAATARGAAGLARHAGRTRDEHRRPSGPGPCRPRAPAS